MSEIYTHFSFQRDGIMYIQLAARPGDEVRGLVADHGQEFDEEVGGRGPSAVYRAGHGAGGVGVSTAAPESLSRVAQRRRCGARAIWGLAPASVRFLRGTRHVCGPKPQTAAFFTDASSSPRAAIFVLFAR